MTNFRTTITFTLICLFYLPSAAGNNGIPHKLDNLQEAVDVISSELDAISNQIVDLDEIRLSIVSLSERVDELETLKAVVKSNSNKITELENLKDSVDTMLYRIEELENLQDTISSMSVRIAELENLQVTIDSISSRVANLESLANTVDSLTTQLDSLESLVLRLDTRLSDFTHCNSLGSLYSPNHINADSDGCAPANSGNATFDATVLHSATANYYSSSKTATIELNSISGSFSHIRIGATCYTLGSDGFNSTSIEFLNSESQSILTMTACSNRGVSNGESSGYRNDFVVPIPVGSEVVRMNTKAIRTYGGDAHNESRITVYVLGNPNE